MVATVKLRLRANLKQSRKARYYWTALSQETDLQARYRVEIRNRYDCLKNEGDQNNITTQYSCLVEANREAAATLLSKKKRDRKLLASEDKRVTAARSELQKVSEMNNVINNPQAREKLQTAKQNLDKAYLEANQDFL